MTALLPHSAFAAVMLILVVIADFYLWRRAMQLPLPSLHFLGFLHLLNGRHNLLRHLHPPLVQLEFQPLT